MFQPIVQVLEIHVKLSQFVLSLSQSSSQILVFSLNGIDVLVISASPSVDLIFVIADGISHVIILFLQVFVLNLKVFQVGRLIVDRIGHLNSALVLNPLQILFLLIQHVQSLDLHFKVIHQLSVFVL